MRFLNKNFLGAAFLAVLGFSSTGWAAGMPETCDNKGFLKAQAANEQVYFQRRAPDVPVHLCGNVNRVFHARKTRSGKHFYFLLNVAPHQEARIVVNLDELRKGHHPFIQKGDTVEVRGRYYYDNPKSQGVDWTHHGTSAKWPWAGSLTVNGAYFD